MTPRVFNIRGPYPRDAVLVNRSTPFGNPFIIGKDGDRKEVIAKYVTWIWQPEQRELRKRMMDELRGKDLVCHCAPEECHAEMILVIANAPRRKRKRRA